MTPSIGRRALAEFIGTAFLVMAVIGWGIAAAKLSPGGVGLELFENAVVTGAALIAIILALGSVSGAHLNPIITGLDLVFGGIGSGDALVYVVAQVAGGVVGAFVANLMFGLRAVEISTQVRTGNGLWLGETVATFGLALVVFGMVRSRRTMLVPFAVGGYIAAAYFFTSSTSFANPAVTFARMFSNTFAGIAPSSVPGFIAFQLVGAVIALGAIRILFPDMAEVADEVMLPHAEAAGAVVTESET
jgi:glycerol uptake facilitator-like aquaporin